MDKIFVTAAVNDEAAEPFEAEHGLTLVLTTSMGRTLFDTGAGKTTAANLRRLGIEIPAITTVFLSHGHYDHTGGIAPLIREGLNADFWHAPGLVNRRWRVEPDLTREISMPAECRAAWEQIDPRKRHETAHFTEIADGIFLTGPIPRKSTETTGGPFYLDSQGITPDYLADEQSLILTAGGQNRLITGCCHAGLINTLDWSAENGLPIQSVLGGLHLNRASEERLQMTADYLNRSSVKRLILLHCTGSSAAEFLQNAFAGETVVIKAGESIDF